MDSDPGAPAHRGPWMQSTSDPRSRPSLLPLPLVSDSGDEKELYGRAQDRPRGRMRE